MKKIYKELIIIVLFLTLSLVIGCTNLGYKEDQELTINESVNIIYVDEAIRLTASVDDVVWSSSDENIVVVDNYGLATGVAVGTVTIKATYNDKEATISLTVIEKEEEAMIVVTGKQTVEVDENISLLISVLNNTNLIQIAANSNDDAIVTAKIQPTNISDTFKCVVTGVSSGLATITITVIGTKSLSKDILIFVTDSSCKNENIDNEVLNKTYEVIGEIDLSSINKKTVDLVNNYKEAIVGVSNYQYYLTDPFSSKKTLERVGIGTGIIYKKERVSKGYKYSVLTNYHVIEDNEVLKIYFGYDDIEVEATHVASDESFDLAILSFMSEEDITIAELGTIDDVNVGDFVVAIGNPTGYDYFGSVTFGIVSYKNRELDSEKALFIQHDAAINPGNSGGPLFNLDGKVIGINTIKIVDSEVENLGFAISIETVLSFLNEHQ